MMWGGDWMGGWAIGFALMHLLWWGLLIGLGALLLRWALRDPGARGTGSGTRDGAAEAILRERFARGEIDQREYEERLGVLRG